MFTSKRKRPGPSKLSLKSQLSQSQTCSQMPLEKSATQLPTSQPIMNRSKEVDSFPTTSCSANTSVQDPDIIDLSSPDEEIFKPSKPKKIKAAPALDKIKTESFPKLEVLEEEKELVVIPTKSDRLTAKLKTFEKEPPKKFPIVRQNSKDCLEPTRITIPDVKPIAPTKKIEEPPAKEETKELPCPVCNKSVGKNRRAHLKTCAGKNGLSTAQLLQAVELQKKQSEEQKELGLPFFLQNQKPLPKKKNGARVENDPNIQLALALSKSLKDAEEEALMRETRLLLENQETFEGLTESQVDATIKAVVKEPSPLKKPQQTVLISSNSGKLKITKNSASTKAGQSSKVAPFMTSTAEERLSRVTEKVAMYLLDDEEEKLPLKVPELRPVEIQQDKTCSALWNLASVSPSTEKKSFYVKELQDFVSPSKSNSGVMHLEPMQMKFRLPPVPKSKINKSSSPKKRKDSSLGKDWAALLNCRTMSDIVIYAKEERELRAHKLVLFVRCPAILKELACEIGEGNKVMEYMLLWSEYSHEVIEAALEFLYCDTTCRAVKLQDEDLNQLEALAQRYEINELEDHINLIKRLREEISNECFESKSLPLNKSGSQSQEEEEEDVEHTRTELSYLVSQMDKSLLPAVKKSSANKILEEEAPEVEVGSQEDLFASMEETQFCLQLMEENTSSKSDEEKARVENDDWRNLEGLDYLQPSPPRPRSSVLSSHALMSPVPDIPPLETSPFSSPELVPLRTEGPREVVSLSSDSASQKSVVALVASPKAAASPSTPKRLPLDDSLDVFEDGDITRLEMAALKAYEKVVTPKPGPSRAASTPAGVTPMADYSLMESPQLQKELDKFGIKRLRRNQAKLILRHIYNELHPIVASTPLARPQEKKKVAFQKRNSPKKQTQTARKLSPKKKQSPSKSKSHNLSMSQPEEYDSFDELLFDKPNKVASASQPPATGHDSDSSVESDSRDDGGYGDELLDEEFTQLPDTQANLPDRIEEALKSDPGLYHRILTYEPIWLEEIKDLLKQLKIKCNPKVLLDYLDDQCITYRHDHQRPARATQKRGWTQSQRGRKKKDYDI